MPEKTIKISALIFLFILLIPSVAFSATTEKEKRETYNLKSWIDSPIRYITTSSEVRDFKALKADQERNNFIYRFWQRRDPTPLTLKNEFRERFWERVITTNQLFAESTKPGWMTDRGKIYIIAGAPNDREYIENPDASVGMNDMHSMGDSGHRGIERWVYQGLPGLKAAPVITVTFYKDASGEFKLSSNPDHLDDIAPGIVPSDANFPNPFQAMMSAGSSAKPEDARQKAEGENEGPKTLGAPAAPVNDGSKTQEMARMTRSVMDQLDEIDKLNALTQFQYDIAEITEPPREDEILKARVRTFEFYEPLPQSIRSSLFEAANGQPYVVLSVETNLKNFYMDSVPANAVIPLSLFGNLKDVNNPQNQFLVTSDSLAPHHIVREKDEVLLSSSLSVPPGTYDATLGVQDLLSGRISLFANKIQVPAFESGRLAMSDIILASRIETPQEGAQAVKSPIPGSLKAIPKMNPVYTNSDELTFFFQIYEVSKDPTSGQPNLEITLQFSKWNNNSFEKAGRPLVIPNIISQEYGRSIPLQKWPQGKFKMDVTVKDVVAGSTASKNVEFEIK